MVQHIGTKPLFYNKSTTAVRENLNHHARTKGNNLIKIVYKIHNQYFVVCCSRSRRWYQVVQHSAGLEVLIIIMSSLLDQLRAIVVIK